MNPVSSLSDALLAAGVPAGFSLRYSGSGLPTIIYAPGTTAAQITAGNSIIASFDMTAPTQAARDVQSARSQASARFDTESDPAFIAVRGVYRALAAKINDLAAALGLTTLGDAAFTSSVKSGIMSGSGAPAPALPAVSTTPVIRGTRSARVPFGPVAAGGTVTVTVTWATPFANANYTIALGTESTGFVNANRILSKTASGCSIQVQNLTGLLVGVAGASVTGTIHVIALSDL